MVAVAERHRFNSQFVSPSEVTRTFVGGPFTSEDLLAGTFRPHYKFFGTHFATLDGVYVMKQNNSFTLVDFSRLEAPGLNLSTLLAVSAALQGSRYSVSRKCDRWGIPTDQRPLPYEDSFHETLTGIIEKAAAVSRDIGFEDGNKQSFYTALSEIIGIVIRGDHPGEAFNYLMGKDTNQRGFSIYGSFFPNLASLISEHAIFYLLNNRDLHKHNLDFEEIIRGFVENEPRKFFGIDTSIELAYLLQFPNDTVQTLIDLSKTTKFIQVDWSRSKDNIIQDINKLKNGKVRKPETKKERDPYPSVEEFGMRINLVETRMLREYFHLNDAVVISPEEIRKNPQMFWKFQRELVLSIAENQGHRGVSLDEGITIHAPGIYSKEQRDTFHETEKLLKDVSDWIWLLLHPSVQEEFFHRLPYIKVPPYVIIDGKAVPIQLPEKQKAINSLINESEGNVVNGLPFLNIVDRDYLKRKGKLNLRHALSIPGMLIKEIMEKGGFVYLDHGIARWIFGRWGDNYKLNERGYAAFGQDSMNQIASVDVDMLVFGINERLGDLSNRLVTKKINPNVGGTLISNLMLGLSMGKVDWTFITKEAEAIKKQLHFIKKDPYMLAHSDACVTQALRAWQSGKPKQPTNLLVEVLTNFSELRSIGLLPVMLTEPSGAEVFAAKPVDIFGGLTQYVEGGGGIEVNGIWKNVVRFVSLEKAFNTRSIWHALRTIGDLIFTANGGVLLPEKVVDVGIDSRVKLEAVLGAVNQFRKTLEPIYDYAARIRNGEIIITSSEKRDLRREMIKSASDFIDRDPSAFITLVSDVKAADLEKLMFGLNLARFFPSMFYLRRYPEAWENIRKEVATAQRLDNESGIHFLARVILGIKMKPSIFSIISAGIQNEFRLKPHRTALKMTVFENEYDRKVDIITEGFTACANWSALDPRGLGAYVRRPNSKRWENFIQLLATEERDAIVEQFKEEPNVLDVINRYSNWNLSTAVEKSKTISPESATEEQITALEDWLIDPGF